jgi:hypothetical protein
MTTETYEVAIEVRPEKSKALIGKIMNHVMEQELNIVEVLQVCAYISGRTIGQFHHDGNFLEQLREDFLEMLDSAIAMDVAEAGKNAGSATIQ